MKTLQEKAEAYDRIQYMAKYRRIRQAIWLRKAEQALRENKINIVVTDDEVQKELDKLTRD